MKSEDHIVEAIRVRHVEGDEFEVIARQHVLHVDQTIADGGSDHGPSPTELFVSSLAACVAFYVHRSLSRHGLSSAGLSVEAAFRFALNPTRVGSITLKVLLPEAVPEERRPAILAVARHCTVHNTLEQTPEIRIELVKESAAA